MNLPQDAIVLASAKVVHIIFDPLKNLAARGGVILSYTYM